MFTLILQIQILSAYHFIPQSEKRSQDTEILRSVKKKENNTYQSRENKTKLFA